MSLEEMQDYYNERAPEYEQIYYRDNQERQQELADQRELVKQLVAGKNVIELACGTGYWTTVASETAKSITAIDASQEMIDQAKQKNYKSDVKFICSNMYSEELKLKNADTALIGFWFSHQPKQEYGKFFALIKSLIKENGEIWLIDNNPPAEGSVNKTSRIDKHGNNYKMRYLDDGREFEILKNYFSEQEILDLFSKDFTIKQLIYKEYYWAVVLY